MSVGLPRGARPLVNPAENIPKKSKVAPLSNETPVMDIDKEAETNKGFSTMIQSVQTEPAPEVRGILTSTSSTSSGKTQSTPKGRGRGRGIKGYKIPKLSLDKLKARSVARGRSTHRRRVSPPSSPGQRLSTRSVSPEKEKVVKLKPQFEDLREEVSDNNLSDEGEVNDLDYTRAAEKQLEHMEQDPSTRMLRNLKKICSQKCRDSPQVCASNPLHL